MENEDQFGYFSKTVAKKLDVATDTLRNWSLKLEAEGISFERNDRNQRIYYDKDIRALENMKELLDLQQPLNEVSKIVAKKIQEGIYNQKTVKNTEITHSVIRPENTSETQEKRSLELENSVLSLTKEAFQEMQIHMMGQFVQEWKKDQMNFVQQMQEKQEEMIKDAVKIALMKERKAIAEEVIKEINQNRLQLAPAEEEKSKTSFWRRLFRNG